MGFLGMADHANVVAWAERIDARPAVRRGHMVNRDLGDDGSLHLPERHSRQDFERTVGG